MPRLGICSSICPCNTSLEYPLRETSLGFCFEIWLNGSASGCPINMAPPFMKLLLRIGIWISLMWFLPLGYCRAFGRPQIQEDRLSSTFMFLHWGMSREGQRLRASSGLRSLPHNPKISCKTCSLQNNWNLWSPRQNKKKKIHCS